MKSTTLCYIENNGRYLMLHRVKKKNDENHDKWIGVGGKCEEKESPYDCAQREIYEETGLTPNELCYRGIVTFISAEYETQYMHLFTAVSETDVIDIECDEGNLEWVEKTEISSLPIWEGDKIFLELLANDTPFFSLRLEYVGDTLVSAIREL